MSKANWPLKGEGAYKGKHWMQDPKNKTKVAKMIAAMHRGRKQAKKLLPPKQKSLRGPYKTRTKENKATSLVVNGWRITLGKGEIRIDNE